MLAVLTSKLRLCWWVCLSSTNIIDHSIRLESGNPVFWSLPSDPEAAANHTVSLPLVDVLVAPLIFCSRLNCCTIRLSITPRSGFSRRPLARSSRRAFLVLTPRTKQAALLTFIDSAARVDAVFEWLRTRLPIVLDVYPTAEGVSNTAWIPHMLRQKLLANPHAKNVV